MCNNAVGYDEYSSIHSVIDNPSKVELLPYGMLGMSRMLLDMHPAARKTP
jgi:hypothetical protein